MRRGRPPIRSHQLGATAWYCAIGPRPAAHRGTRPDFRTIGPRHPTEKMRRDGDRTIRLAFAGAAFPAGRTVDEIRNFPLSSRIVAAGIRVKLRMGILAGRTFGGIDPGG